jgi:hypothetical protein
MDVTLPATPTLTLRPLSLGPDTVDPKENKANLLRAESEWLREIANCGSLFPWYSGLGPYIQAARSPVLSKVPVSALMMVE